MGPFSITEVISAHRVRLDLPPDLNIDPVMNIEQLDLEPVDDDPFAADRPLFAPVSPPVASASDVTVPGPSRVEDDGSLVDVETTVDEVPRAVPPRARRPPLALQDFQLGTMRSIPSPALQDLLHGPLLRPRTLQEGDNLLTLTERPVAFLSRLTSPVESRLVAPELELVCLAWAYQKLAHLLEGAITTVVTDHAPMERMLRSTAPIAYGPTITRCRAVLMPHLPNLRFVYRPGPRHTNADALSRLPIADQGRSAP
ncbi:hypothetical protein A4X13_0g7127 [Tilletia indica]|uniref:Reverse transcriptase RNase H-like domain-containing protein n=1 Tax=Tilletia indica TaxID=43049 RepID=A0A177T636_9BASI|nr:hypothetical protein A4X13_0g7127 [Tilletia indica]